MPVESPAITIELVLPQIQIALIELKEPMVNGIVCNVEKLGTTLEHAQRYTPKEKLEDQEPMVKESVASVEKLDTILGHVRYYFQTEFREIPDVEKESVINVEKRVTIRGLVQQSIPRLLLLEN